MNFHNTEFTEARLVLVAQDCFLFTQSASREPGGGGVAAQQVVILRKHYASGCPFLTKVMRQGIAVDKKIMPQMWKEILQSSLGTVNHVYFWYDRYVTGYTSWALFMRQGIGCGDIFHTPPSHP